jgi:hypothetical protein
VTVVDGGVGGGRGREERSEDGIRPDGRDGCCMYLDWTDGCGYFNKTDVGLDWQSGERHNDTHRRPLPRPRGATYHMSARPEASGPSGS